MAKKIIGRGYESEGLLYFFITRYQKMWHAQELHLHLKSMVVSSSIFVRVEELLNWIRVNMLNFIVLVRVLEPMDEQMLQLS